MKVLLAGGGTAGHINPLLATAAALVAGGDEVLALGTQSGLEAELVPAAGVKLEYIPKVPLPRKPSLDLLKVPLNLSRAVKRCEQICRDFQPDVVVGFGGYVSTPLYLAARKMGISIAIHEQNARPGLANRLGARFAKALGLTFASTPLKAKAGITEVVGLPLRPAIGQLVKQKAEDDSSARIEAAKHYGFDPALPTLLVTGGSLGAAHLNQVFADNLGTLPKNVQVLHLTGKGKASDLLRLTAHLPNYRVQEYEPEMEKALAIADLVVCRSGAGTVAEMTALGLPAVYVPLPIGNGEQKLNAADVVAAGGAKLVLDKDFSAQTLTEVVWPWLTNPQELATASLASASCGVQDAAQRFAQLVRKVA
ncbi:undecaprenyldiphospho-muramoylpentapeptide beta-N-acetylglucosaminyltransferase [Boudabousia tangfeifanii]|uniref:UDP-N-acetylglucosamine--N-acetylmuramyl-(pentapeptide) pyrophosphoryl-undecaprenol N-acetylglucosamine transferase n=1 Tax=Boudabousia tangfeifanii TaxID=1912795 RepID=A0A1D9MKM2_9ACTO|nr:undecaprenyldiphospho-muramoylpentapeptide beta-N-acetylglucosaminyltransferase [Boudabousia tangfeifanii]AOZ72845.1 undecaprenyldiphospho-muramoylpentapeptide beta-N-acetylglucosaminyltransferase [Boudabousia tangfeifanii]